MAERKSHSNYEQIMATIKHEHVSFVNLEFTDVVGIVKCVTIPAAQFPNCIEHGKWFDGSALEGFARVAESDMYLFPDLSTFTILPGRVRGHSTGPQGVNITQTEHDVVARVICDVRTPDGERFDGDPRTALSRALEHARSMGFKYQVAPELEFFLLSFEDNKPVPLPHDKGSYFDLSTDATVSIRGQMVSVLQKMGIKIEASHHEVAPGQHELDFEISDALHIADGLTTAKYVIKALAAQHGLYATFLPKPFYGINGSGMHIHQQLINLETGKNAFMDEQDDYGLSEIGGHFIAGQLAHARSLCGILAPLVNSYKRLVRGYEAPVFVNWGRVNRQGLIRVPYPGSDPFTSLRIELRCADATCNPHLALAVMLRAGLDGIQRKMTLQPAMDENIFLQDESERLRPRARLLPLTLGEALEGMNEDALIREALGATIYEGFIDAKSIEWTEYRQQVHSWEIERYLPVF
ncbi:MAG TPA: glutamine synthetase family protein [Ktedonobacteraceae bacterium]|nr:glutamine synthetase family protein [Ktedonobacteraceae bacterium]